MEEPRYKEYMDHISLNVSEEIKQFVRDEVFGKSEYLFVTKVDGKNKAYCSKCSHEYEIADVKQNETGICPICGSSLKVKLSRYGRKNCKNEACFYYFEKSVIDPNVVVCKGYYVMKDYTSDYKNLKVIYELCAIYVFEDKKATMLKNNWYNGWEKKSSVFDFNQGWLAPKMCFCSFESIKKAIKNTSYRYMPYKMFQGYYSMVKLFGEYLKYPCIEYLAKEGFKKLVEDKLNGYPTYRTVNWNGKTIFKILKINKLDLREIKNKKVHVTFNFLKVFQDCKKQNWGLSIEEVIKVSTEYLYHYDAFKNLTQYSTIKKLLKYFSKQYDRYNGTPKDKHYYGEGSVLSNFRDYIADCKLLEMDITSEQVLFPKDLYTAHQNMTKQIKLKADETLNLKMKARMKSLEKYGFQYNGLMIRAASNSNELIEEGKALSHCVGTYADRHARGETNIFFIRKISELDKPYFTIEIRQDKVIQVHGKNNRSPDAAVAEFVKEFTAEKLDNHKAKNRIKIPA